MFRFIRRALYSLKRQYAMPVTVCTSTIVTDYDTGIQAETLTKYAITKAIVLPAREMRSFMPDITSISPYKNGAIFDSSLRRIIIDRRDLPSSYEPTANDFIFFNSRRYEIKYFEDYEHKEAILFMIDMTRGAPMMDTLTGSVSDTLVVDDEATYVIQ